MIMVLLLSVVNVTKKVWLTVILLPYARSKSIVIYKVLCCSTCLKLKTASSILRKTHSDVIKLKCIEDMFKANIALVNMYNLLPRIAENVPIDVINSNNKIDYDKDLSVY